MNNQRMRKKVGDPIVWLILFWIYFVTLSRAIRFPNDYAEAHWLLDYRFGFMKRGLVGAVCGAVLDFCGLTMTPGIVVGLSALILIGMSVAVFWILCRVCQRQSGNDVVWLVGLVFLSSPFVVICAHTFGYFDALLYLLAVIAVQLVLKKRAGWAAFVSAVAVLVHEGYLLIGVPLTCLAAASITQRDDAAHIKCSAALLLAVPVLVFVAVIGLQSCMTDAQILRAQWAHYLRACRFVSTRCDYVAVAQTTSFWELFREQYWLFENRMFDPKVLASIGPSLVALLVIIYERFQLRSFSAFSFLLLLAIYVPCVMHFIAWDTARISSWLIGNAFLAFWIVAEAFPGCGEANVFQVVAFLALLANIFGRAPLMDYEIERFITGSRIFLYLPGIGLFLRIVFREKTNAGVGTIA